MEVKTIEGEGISLKIPATTLSGTVVKIRGKGIPHFGGLGQGDLQVQLVVKIPKTLTREQKEVLKRLEEEGM